MLDRHMRRLLAGPLDALAARADRRGVTAGTVTAVGFALGVGACVAYAGRWWGLALVLWLANRLADGLDGPIARRRGPTAGGGYLDIVADFAVYGGFVVAVAVAEPDARLAAVTLLGAYYVSGTAFLAFSALTQRQAATTGDGRSVRFVGGLAEGTETVVVYVALCLAPAHAAVIAWVFAAIVAVTAVQRVVGGLGQLNAPGAG